MIAISISGRNRRSCGFFDRVIRAKVEFSTTHANLGPIPIVLKKDPIRKLTTSLSALSLVSTIACVVGVPAKRQMSDLATVGCVTAGTLMHDLKAVRDIVPGDRQGDSVGHHHSFAEPKVTVSVKGFATRKEKAPRSILSNEKACEPGSIVLCHNEFCHDRTSNAVAVGLEGGRHSSPPARLYQEIA